MKPVLLAVAVAATALVTVLAPTAALAEPTPVNAAAATTVSARHLLSELKVAVPDYSHRYQRARFGYEDPSLDADGDGCTTRKEVLIRDHVGAIRVSSSCAVYSHWRSIYDDRLTSDPLKLEIDHLVPLAEAWHAGAWRWSHTKQIAFGNDLGYRWDLQAVTARLNQQKEDDDPALWMPPKNRCTYVKAWIGVKSRWHLTVDPAEKAALVKWLGKCASVKVAKPGTPDIAALAGTKKAAGKGSTASESRPTATPSATASPSPTVTQSAVPVASSTPSATPTTALYANCDAVRAAGKAPLHRGDPGYSSKLDRDGDGIACE